MTKSQEFQAIVLAGGKGSRMLDLTHAKSKCFLPIGNYPMVWYPLRLLQTIGFQEVIVVTQEWAKDEMAKLPKQYGLDLQLDIVTFASHDDLGTADALRLVHGRLTAENIMVVSSDLLVDVNQIRHLTDLHRVHRSSVTSLFAPISIDPKQIQVPGPKAKQKTEKDLVGIDKSNGQLCFLSSEADLNEVISIKRSLLKEHPRITVHSNLLDGHFYIFEKWVADFIYNDREFTAVKGELLPYLVRRQFHRLRENKTEQFNEVETPNPKVTANDHDLENYLHKDERQMVLQAQALSSWNDHTGDLKDAYRNRLLRVYAFVMDRGGTCIRVNNLVSYCEVNRQIGQLWPLLVAERDMVVNHPTANIQPKAVIGPECFVGEESYVSDKTTIKNCTIGARCKIEEKVRLTNCILMDNVVVKSGSNLQGSLLCDEVTVEERADVKDSIIGQGQTVPAEAKISNEVVYDDDSRMYI